MKNRNCTIFALAFLALVLTPLQSLAQSIYEPYTFTTLAGNAGSGSADGTGSMAQFGGPFGGPLGVAVDSAGNVYVADTGNNTIRKGYPALAITYSGPNLGFSGGQFGFNLTGPAGQLVIVEASSDLVSWLPLWTNTFAAALHFSDLQSGISSNRFYRARAP